MAEEQEEKIEYPFKKGDWLYIQAPLKGMKNEHVRVMSLDQPEDMFEKGTLYFRRGNRKIGFMALSTAMKHFENGLLSIDKDYKPPKREKKKE